MRAKGLTDIRALMAEATARERTVWPFEDDVFLLAFLRARKFEVPRAFKVLRNFAAFWWANPETVAALSAEAVREEYAQGVTRVLVARDPENRMISLMLPRNMVRLDVNSMLRLSVYVMLWAIRQVRACGGGGVLCVRVTDVPGALRACDCCAGCFACVRLLCRVFCVRVTVAPGAACV